MSLCARILVGSALRAVPRRAVRSSRDATPLGTSGGRRRVQGTRAVRGVVSAASDADVASTRAVAPPWKDEVLESHSLLGNVCFVLCGPQGPQNVGSVARVMQNFGIYDLRITEPGPFVLAGGRTREDVTPEDVTPADGASSSGGVNSGATLGPDGLGSELPPALRPTRPDGNPADDDPTSPDPLCDEAYRFACAADWLLAESKRCDTALDAIADCTFVMATTARPRGNVPLVTARVAAEMLAREAKRGKVAVLFGNERTGLTNEELAQAHACVAIPTAGQGTLCRRSLKYTGGTGPTSLNLSQAVGVLAYEMFMAADAARETVPGSVPGDGESAPKGVNAGRIDLPASQLMTVGEKNTLLNELLAARRSLDVLPNENDSDAAEDSEDADAGEEDDDLDVREERGIERVLNSSPLARRDAAALFQLARRVKAAAKAGDDSSGAGSSSGLLDAAVLRAVAEVDGTRTVRKARAKIRERLGVSLTNREIARAIRRAAASATAASSE
jgi:tRNA C32,U32 (ribose-2'-O)-methylase TrmJ